MKKNKLVCLCNHVSTSEIKAILRAGALTTFEIQKFTSAGTGCGRCINEIGTILEKHRKDNDKNPQLRIRFETK